MKSPARKIKGLANKARERARTGRPSPKARDVTDLDAILLQVVVDRGSCHGLEIAREAEARTERPLGLGSMYRSLRRMEENDGYLRSYWEEDGSEASHKGPKRRYYEVNASGLRALNDYKDRFLQTAKGLRMGVEPR